MIKVQIHPDRYPAAKEFFELFKTEWSLYESEEACVILLSDETAPPTSEAALQIIYSSNALPGDKLSTRAKKNDQGFYLVNLPNGEELALYHTPRLFSEADQILITENETKHPVAYSKMRSGKQTVRVGYNLFDEVNFLLSSGQPLQNASLPSLDRHIAFLRQTIRSAGFPVVEIPPAPPDHTFMVCLTHDVDFLHIRDHRLDHTLLGFVYRATFGSVRDLFSHRITLRKVIENGLAVLSIPLIYLGICRDFWMKIESYREIEEPFHSTFFLIPFPNRPGSNLQTEVHPKRRAARYRIEDIIDEITSMQSNGWEFGLHGIDAWQNLVCARQERNKISSVLGKPCSGTRTHWLMRNNESEELFDTVGFEYDSSAGYNETIGFRAGTSQVFRPLNAHRILEIPLHIQDVSLFYNAFLHLNEKDAWSRCTALLEHQKKNGGVVTLLWHMRSLAPERLWGDFYRRLLDECVRLGARVGTAHETAAWFNARRQLNLSTRHSSGGQQIVCVTCGNRADCPKMTLRVYQPGTDPNAFVDTVWHGQPEITISAKGISSHPAREVPA